MKKFVKILLLSIVALSLVACSSDKQEDTAGSETLTVYSPHPAETINLVVKEFKEKTGINVDVVAAGTGELLKRVESEDGKPLGDVLWGGGAESLASYTDYFEAYESPELANIDAQYYDKDFKWIGESPLPMVLMYNTNLVEEGNAPTSWQDLTNPEFKGKIAMADPAKSGSAYTILATMVQAYGKDDGKGWDFVREFYANLDGKVLTSSSAVYKGVADGEYSVGLTLEKEAIKYVLNDAPVKIVYPNEGTSAIPDGVAIIKDANNMDNAKKFVDFVLSKDTQEIMSNKLSRRSIRKDAEAPEGLEALSTIKLVDYDFNWAASDKDVILKQWKDIIIGE
ncbi:ABC transporter substrate-binding protein [Erysipelothrix tonsillarum]|uniref:ABC transporter substrate-binding protein n=1 Tax=Erysipelothrix tonsillarum TaxID=38402 RepID=UPI00036F55E0|nr:ABC transporter substrate-binding protein [Erysipelothrix tonsillarum]